MIPRTIIVHTTYESTELPLASYCPVDSTAAPPLTAPSPFCTASRVYLLNSGEDGLATEIKQLLIDLGCSVYTSS